MNWTTRFDRGLDVIPSAWRGPLVDVCDTARMVTLFIQDDLKLEPTPDLVVGLTRLVLERRPSLLGEGEE